MIIWSRSNTHRSRALLSSHYFVFSISFRHTSYKWRHTPMNCEIFAPFMGSWRWEPLQMDLIENNDFIALTFLVMVSNRCTTLYHVIHPTSSLPRLPLRTPPPPFPSPPSSRPSLPLLLPAHRWWRNIWTLFQDLSTYYENGDGEGVIYWYLSTERNILRNCIIQVYTIHMQPWPTLYDGDSTLVIIQKIVLQSWF